MRGLLLLTVLIASAASAQETATYRVRFEATWSAAAFPSMFPVNAHWSPLVGASHDAGVSLWEPGGTATAGMEAMAERGQTALLVSEALAFRAAGHAAETFVGPDIPVSPGAAEVTVTATEAASLLSVVTMVAPSPDWFVGVHGLDLRPGGAWASHEVVLFTYDSGTDSGLTYTAANADTQPREPIALIQTDPFLVDGSVRPVGTLYVDLLSVTAGESDIDAAAFALSAPSPNPARGSASLTLTLDRAQPVTVRVVDALGRTVAVVADGEMPAGALRLRVDTGRLAAGLYTVVATGDRTAATQRIAVVGR